MPYPVQWAALLVIALGAVTGALADQVWQGVANSSCEASGHAAAFDAAKCVMAKDIGRRLAEESATDPHLKTHPFGNEVGVEVARLWLEVRQYGGVRRLRSDRTGDKYVCEISLAGKLPTLDEVRGDLLKSEVLDRPRFNPLVLCEIVTNGDDWDKVLQAFLHYLDSPVLTDLFNLDNSQQSSFSPIVAYELHNHPDLVRELSISKLFDLLKELPGDKRIMDQLLDIAAEAGQKRSIGWITNYVSIVTPDKEPKFVEKNYPFTAANAHRSNKFVTPVLKWFYGQYPPRIFRYGNTRPPKDQYYAKACWLCSNKHFDKAYKEYLKSIDLVLSYDACLGARACAKELARTDPAYAAEADFFLLQAVAIDRNREPAKQWLADREEELRSKKGPSDD